MTAEKAKFWLQLALDTVDCSVLMRIDGLKFDRRKSSKKLKKFLNEAIREIETEKIEKGS